MLSIVWSESLIVLIQWYFDMVWHQSHRFKSSYETCESYDSDKGHIIYPMAYVSLCVFPLSLEICCAEMSWFVYYCQLRLLCNVTCKRFSRPSQLRSWKLEVGAHKKSQGTWSSLLDAAGWPRPTQSGSCQSCPSGCSSTESKWWHPPATAALWNCPQTLVGNPANTEIKTQITSHGYGYDYDSDSG